MTHPAHLAAGRQQVFAGGAERRELEHRAPARLHRPPEREQLVLGRERPGHGPTVHRPVSERAGGREPERARLHRLLHDGRHRRDLFGVRRLVGRAPLPHRVRAHRAVRDLHADVDPELARPERVEVLRERLPAPVHALGERGAGDVLDALHEGDQPLLVARADRREPDATVAGDDGGHAVTGRRLEQRVPRGLTVVVRVDVDEAGGDEHAVGIDGLGRVTVERRLRHRDDHAVLHRDVAGDARGAGTVDDRAVGDLDVVHVSSSQPRTSSTSARLTPLTNALGR